MFIRSILAYSAAIFLFCYPFSSAFAQSADPTQDILPPSPTAASITKYVDFPVNTSTGTASISIPIGGVAGNGVSLPASLDCHAGGVKVDEVSSIIGLSWSLNAGGAVTRTIMGKRDEDANGFMYHSGDVPITPINSNAKFTAMQSYADGNIDGQPDVFQFSFGSYSGKFVMETPTIIRLIPQQDLKITYTTCTGAGCPASVEDGSIISFTITTPDGIQYLFGTIDAVETSKTVNSNLSGYTGCRPKEFTAPTITAWQLKSVTNPRTGDAITLTYNSYVVSHEFSYNESFSYKDPANSSSCNNTTAVSKCITTKTDNGKILASVASSRGKIEFTPNATRSDVSIISGNYRISEAKIYGTNNQLLKSFQFDQTFVQSTASPANSSPVTAAATKYRMYLDGIREFSATGTQINAWVFEYYNRTSLPPRLSYKQDHWGYYNNKSNTQLTPAPSNAPGGALYVQSLISGFSAANREPDEAYAYYGNLKKITYPTGGYVEYEYESNQLAVCNTVDVPTPTNASADLMFTGTEGETQLVNFTVDVGQTVAITYDVQQNGLHFEGAYAQLKRLSPTPATIVKKGAQLASPAVISGTENYYLSAGSYQIEVKVYKGPLGSGYGTPFDNLPDRATINVPYSDNVPTYFNNKTTGGIRLKKTTFSDVNGTSPNIVKVYQYQKSSPACTNASSAIYQGSEPRYWTVDYSIFNPYGIPCTYNLCQYNRLSSSSILGLTNNAGAIVTYREIWELNGVNAENGKKYYRHEVFLDENPQQGPNYYQLFLSTPNIDYSWKNGKVVEEKSFNAQNQVVYQKLYDYEFNELTKQTKTKGFVARKAFTPECTGSYIYYCDGVDNEGDEYHVVYEPCGLPGLCSIAYIWYFPCYGKPAGYQITNTNEIEPYAYEWYDIVSQFVYLKKTTERIYNSNGSGSYVETITDNQYDLPLMRHLMPVKTITTNGDGYQYATITKYPPEYATTTATDVASIAIKNLLDNYVISTPVEIVQTIKKSGVEYVTGGQLLKYKNFGGSKTFPNLIYQLGTTTPITGFPYSAITGGNFTADSRYYQTKTIGNYNSAGKLLEWNKMDDPVKKQYIWGHNNTLPIAEVINAESNEIAYTSFEDPPVACLGPLGYWQFQGQCGGWNNTAGNYVTGRTGFNLSPARTMSCTVPAGKYIISSWHKDGSFVVNGTVVSTSTGGVWKYAEKEITLSASGTITISSLSSDWSQFIDELRLHPSDALMSTRSFDDRSNLLLTVADENSVTAQYEYDDSQRLQIIRDQDQNILQTYEYNYRPGGIAMNEVKSRTVLVSGKTTIAQVNALVGAEVKRVFQYLDGLGRPIQANEVEQSPAANDIVIYQLYDAFGRGVKNYLPYTVTSNGGAYRTGYAAEQSTFINNYGAGSYGYAESRLEASPLNRPLEQAAPGATWRIGAGHTMEYLYRGNSTTDAVRDFTNNTSFADNLLSVTQETDENEQLKWSFTDKIGRVVLMKQQLNATETAQTYTVYDDFGRVLCVIPPETTKRMINSGNWDYNNSTYSSMIFKYTYDSRGRMVSKTVPSGGTTTIAYDRLDRPVLNTDANGFKSFIRYDILSRPIVSGKYKGAGSPGASDPLFETPNTVSPHYYTSTAFPTDNNLDVYKVSYYDDYDIDNNSSLGASEVYTNPAESGYETAAFLRTRGKSTTTKIGILLNSGAAPTTFLTTRVYYDKEYSVIQVNKQNHLGGSDITSSAYDFANRVTKTRRDHTATPPGGTLKTYTVREEYVYDHASRLRFTRHKINSNNWVVTTAPIYDELGRLQDKRLHASNYDGVSAVTLASTFNYLQSLDYTYNIRGWLTGINDPATCSIQAGDQLADVFSMGLDYENTTNGASPQYNGNIAALQWRTNVNGACLTRQQYRCTYDYANRLTAASHYTHNGTAWVNTNNYTENNLTYDLNGNIKTCTRRGLTTAPSTFGTIDQLTYIYGDALRPDRLTQLSDAGSATKGFVYNASATAYQYDLNGNMTQDNHKGFTIAYNYLNLPITFTKGANVITMTYTADGEKLTKTVTGGGATKNYVSGLEYSGANLDAIYFSEGRCTPNGATAFYYDYTIKDHLGNARVNFRANGTAITFLQELHYYPFGMVMEGIGTAAVTNNPYKYNSKELNEDFGLNLSDYGARWYDASLGKWWSADPLAEKYMPLSPYNYCLNNPVIMTDPDGRGVIITIVGTGDDMKVVVTANVYVYAEEGSGIDPDKYADQYREELQNQYAGFKTEEGTDVEFNINVTSVCDSKGAQEKYKELRSHKTRSGYKTSNPLAANENFVLLSNDPDKFSASFGNYAVVNVNGTQGVMSHEMGHLMGFMTQDENDGQWMTHPLKSDYHGIMGNKPDRHVTQGEVFGLNFGYGLTGKADPQKPNRDYAQIRDLGVTRYAVGNNSSKDILQPFNSVKAAKKILEGMNRK